MSPRKEKAASFSESGLNPLKTQTNAYETNSETMKY